MEGSCSDVGQSFTQKELLQYNKMVLSVKFHTIFVSNDNLISVRGNSYFRTKALPKICKKKK